MQGKWQDYRLREPWRGSMRGTRERRGWKMSRSIRLLAAAAVVGLLLMVSAQVAVPVDVQKVAVIHGHGRENGGSDYYFFAVMVEGADIDNVRCVDTDSGGTPRSMALTPESSTKWWYEDPVDYPTFAALCTAHKNPNGLVSFYFNEGEADYDWDQVGYNMPYGPTGFATITNPGHGDTGVLTNPNYKWTDVSAIPHAVGIHKFVDEDAGPVRYEVFFDNDLTQTSWQPGPLAGLTDYAIGVAVVNVQSSAGKFPITATTNVYSKSYDYYGVWASGNENEFTTMIPEPGTIALIGSAMLALVGLRWRRRMK